MISCASLASPRDTHISVGNDVNLASLANRERLNKDVP